MRTRLSVHSERDEEMREAEQALEKVEQQLNITRYPQQSEIEAALTHLYTDL